MNKAKINFQTPIDHMFPLFLWAKSILYTHQIYEWYPLKSSDHNCYFAFKFIHVNLEGNNSHCFLLKIQCNVYKILQGIHAIVSNGFLII